MMSLARAARALAARASGADASFTSVSTDSRALSSGALFVALRGERFDGHRFLQEAIAAGAAAAMVDETSQSECAMEGLPLLLVKDTRIALGELAAYWRAQHTLPVIGVAGSNGKTTVKEMIATILRAHFGTDRTLATEGNLNNDIGVPLTVLRLRSAHLAGVVEIGMNHAGETAHLAAIAQPSIALVNNAQREHQEFMKGVHEVAREHASLIAALPKDGIAVLNADDAYANLWREAAARAGAAVRDFGVEHAAAVGARYRFSGYASEITITMPEGEAQVRLELGGEHAVRNALAAAAAATAAGASVQAVAAGLSAFAGAKGRQQLCRGPGGAMIIDDSYNANPDSVRAATDALAAVPGRKMLVLGDMGEVGEQGPAFHEEIGSHARAAGFERLFAIGDLSRRAVAAFGAGAAHFDSIEDLVVAVRKELAPQVSVLVKGSRFMRMERVVRELIDTPSCKTQSAD
jgi:UDP-N-acetylmuramoyl-tripeptide--D-alanyl-D-alanine ligase